MGERKSVSEEQQNGRGTGKVLGVEQAWWKRTGGMKESSVKIIFELLHVYMLLSCAWPRHHSYASNMPGRRNQQQEQQTGKRQPFQQAPAAFRQRSGCTLLGHYKPSLSYQACKIKPSAASNFAGTWGISLTSPLVVLPFTAGNKTSGEGRESGNKQLTLNTL